MTDYGRAIAIIVDSARHNGYCYLPEGQRNASLYGQIIVMLCHRGVLRRVWRHHRLTDQHLVHGAPGHVVGVQLV